MEYTAVTFKLRTRISILYIRFPPLVQFSKKAVIILKTSKAYVQQIKVFDFSSTKKDEVLDIRTKSS